MSILFGIVMSTALTILGFKFANKYYQHLRFFDDLIVFFEYLRNNLSFQSDTMNLVFSNYHDTTSDVGRLVQSLSSSNEHISQDFLREELSKYSFLSANDKTQLIQFFNNFGTTDLDTQLQNVDSILLWTKQRQKFAHTQCNEKGKMYRTLSVILGLVVLVIYI